MSRTKNIMALILAALCGCGGDRTAARDEPGTAAVRPDFSTPEGALLSLEDAYRRKDIEGAVKSKDFRIEARLMLLKLGKLPADQVDEELISKTAEVLELAYRKQLEQEGIPDMLGVRSTFPKTEPYQHGIVLVTEVCHYQDGGTSTQRMLVAKTAGGWRVLNPVE